MAVVKRFASSEKKRVRDHQGKFTTDQSKFPIREESHSKLDNVVWISEKGNTYIRREKEKMDVSTLFLYASILLVVIFK